MSSLNEKTGNMLGDLIDCSRALEKSAVDAEHFPDLTANDLHVIAVVGTESAPNMTMIAKKLRITVGSLTTAINNLIRKEYVVRERDNNDRRVVRVKLTGKGQEVFDSHVNFKEKVNQELLESMSEEELEILKRAILKVTGIAAAVYEEKNNR